MTIPSVDQIEADLVPRASSIPGWFKWIFSGVDPAVAFTTASDNLHTRRMVAEEMRKEFESCNTLREWTEDPHAKYAFKDLDHA